MVNQLNKTFVFSRQDLQGNFIIFPVKRGLQQPAVKELMFQNHQSEFYQKCDTYLFINKFL